MPIRTNHPPRPVHFATPAALLAASLLAGAAAAQDGFSQVSLDCYQQAARGADTAAAVCERAAEAGDAHAAFLLATGERDAARRVQRLERAVSLGHPRAAAVLARVRRQQGEAERAGELQAMAARGGFGPSRIRVAQGLRASGGDPQNQARARNILLAEAAAGYPQAQYLVAGMLKTGQGGEVDEAAAEAWMREAASAGHVQAQFEFGVAQARSNPRAGRRWLIKAARAGHVGAMYQLSRLIDAGRAGRAAKVQARYWASRAILHGHPEAPALYVAIGDPADAPASTATGPNLVAQVQQALANLGYDPGPMDGIPGERTLSAVEAFRQANDQPLTRTIDAELLGQLRRAANASR